MKKVIFGALLLLHQNGFTKTVILDNTRVLTLNFSINALNRVTLEADDIENVFLAPIHLSNNVELDASGHLFITGDEMTREAYLSLVTSGGTVQDFKILFDAKEPEPTFLSLPQSEDTGPLPLESEDVGPLLARVRDGDLTAWKLSPLKAGTRVVGDLTATHDISYIHEKDPLVVHIFHLKGQGDLNPAHFQKKGDLALVMNEKTLTQNTRLFVVQERR